MPKAPRTERTLQVRGVWVRPLIHFLRPSQVLNLSLCSREFLRIARYHQVWTDYASWLKQVHAWREADEGRAEGLKMWLPVWQPGSHWVFTWFLRDLQVRELGLEYEAGDRLLCEECHHFSITTIPREVRDGAPVPPPANQLWRYRGRRGRNAVFYNMKDVWQCARCQFKGSWPSSNTGKKRFKLSSHPGYPNSFESLAAKAAEEHGSMDDVLAAADASLLDDIQSHDQKQDRHNMLAKALEGVPENLIDADDYLKGEGSVEALAELRRQAAELSFLHGVLGATGLSREAALTKYVQTHGATDEALEMAAAGDAFDAQLTAALFAQARRMRVEAKLRALFDEETRGGSRWRWGFFGYNRGGMHRTSPLQRVLDRAMAEPGVQAYIATGEGEGEGEGEGVDLFMPLRERLARPLLTTYCLPDDAIPHLFLSEALIDDSEDRSRTGLHFASTYRKRVLKKWERMNVLSPFFRGTEHMTIEAADRLAQRTYDERKEALTKFCRDHDVQRPMDQVLTEYGSFLWCGIPGPQRSLDEAAATYVHNSVGGALARDVNGRLRLNYAFRVDINSAELRRVVPSRDRCFNLQVSLREATTDIVNCVNGRLAEVVAALAPAMGDYVDFTTLTLTEAPVVLPARMWSYIALNTPSYEAEAEAEAEADAPPAILASFTALRLSTALDKIMRQGTPPQTKLGHVMADVIVPTYGGGATLAADVEKIKAEYDKRVDKIQGIYRQFVTTGAYAYNWQSGPGYSDRTWCHWRDIFDPHTWRWTVKNGLDAVANSRFERLCQCGLRSGPRYGWKHGDGWERWAGDERFRELLEYVELGHGSPVHLVQAWNHVAEQWADQHKRWGALQMPAAQTFIEGGAPAGVTLNDVTGANMPPTPPGITSRFHACVLLGDVTEAEALAASQVRATLPDGDVLVARWASGVRELLGVPLTADGMRGYADWIDRQQKLPRRTTRQITQKAADTWPELLRRCHLQREENPLLAAIAHRASELGHHGVEDTDCWCSLCAGPKFAEVIEL